MVVRMPVVVQHPSDIRTTNCLNLVLRTKRTGSVRTTFGLRTAVVRNTKNAADQSCLQEICDNHGFSDAHRVPGVALPHLPRDAEGQVHHEARWQFFSLLYLRQRHLQEIPGPAG